MVVRLVGAASVVLAHRYVFAGQRLLSQRGAAYLQTSGLQAGEYLALLPVGVKARDWKAIRIYIRLRMKVQDFIINVSKWINIVFVLYFALFPADLQ